MKQAENPFGPYEFLIGEWDVKSETEGSPIGVQRVRWGPNRSYIWYAVTLLSDGREEPHLEGMLVWNGVHKNLDMLFVMDFKSGRVQEQGTMAVEADGSLVRNITAVYSPGVQAMTGAVGPGGATAHFRQTYKQIGLRQDSNVGDASNRARLGRNFPRKRSSAAWCVGRAIPKAAAPCVMSIAVETLLDYFPAPRSSENSRLEIPRLCSE